MTALIFYAILIMVLSIRSRHYGKQFRTMRRSMRNHGFSWLKSMTSHGFAYDEHAAIPEMAKQSQP